MNRTARLLAVVLLPACIASHESSIGAARSTSREPRIENRDPLPPAAERAYRAVAGRFNAHDALEVVAFMDRYWRLAGNSGFNASIDHFRDRLIAARFNPAAT